MTGRSYNQFCALASALDVIGERWSLLIIRELLPGPRRYTDLLEGLPGISTNLLSNRLKRFEADGLVRRRELPPPASSTVYELTPMARSLESPVLELGRWGAQHLPRSLKGIALPSPGAISVAMKAFFHPERADGLNETYQLHLGAEVLQVKVREGQLSVMHGAADKPAVVVHTDMPTFLGLFTGQLSVRAAQKGGHVRLEGDLKAFDRLLDVCHVPVSESD